jgi:hypothetical protein
LFVREKTNVLLLGSLSVRLLSVLSHIKGVYPPIFLPNSVSMRVTVSGCRSHFLWKMSVLNSFYDARYSKVIDSIDFR